MINDIEAVISLLLHSSQDVLGGSLLSQSAWSSESGLVPDLSLTSLMNSLLDCSCCFLGYGLILWRQLD
jgi:hypothetical protein